MKLKSLVLMAVAAGCGLVAMVGVQQVLSGDKKVEKAGGKVLVAVTDIPPGHPLNETNVAFRDWPVENIPKGAVTTQEEYEQRSLRVGAVSSEVIMLAKLGRKGEIGVSSAIPEGMRVATVQVNTTKTHSGSIMPGDRVDVVATYKIKVPGAGMITKAKTVLQYIEVFATDNIRVGSAVQEKAGDNQEINAKNISLLVTPDQYNLLMLAENKGQLTLALRSAGDETMADAKAVDERAFDDADTSNGDAEANHETAAEDGEKPGKNSVRKFLTEEHAKADPKPVQKIEVKPVVPTWTIRVYDGQKLREEKVELPGDPAAKPTSEAGSGTEQGTSWKGWLQNTFHRGA